MRLLPVAAEQLDEAWPLIERWIARATDESPHCSPEDIREAVKLKDASLWAVADDERLIGAVVGQIVIWPQVKVGLLRLASADDGHRDEWLPLLEPLEQWARSYGCGLMELYGRPGWARVIKRDGMRVTSTLTWRLA